MTNRTAADYLGHILRAGRKAVGFCDGMTIEAFRGDRRTQQAVVMSLIVMGEAVV
nr:HepT-like ribonuclease domain-containing protein [Rhizobium sp. G21]